MSGFALLWAKILDSSLWVKGSKETRLVWITLLAMRDKDGVVQASKVGLADRAKVKEEECEAALEELLGPDENDTSGVEDGKRLREVPGGWQIVNHERYMFATEARRMMWRESKARQRAKVPKRGKPLRGEEAYRKALERGDEAEADRIAAQGVEHPVRPCKRSESPGELVVPPEVDTHCVGQEYPGGVDGGDDGGIPLGPMDTEPSP